MSKPKVIVTIAPTGGMATKTMNPNLPTQPEEIADDTYRCYNAGASLVAVHARRPDDEATCEPAIYTRINRLIRDKCDIILNNSTGGGINGDMVRPLPNGLWEIQWEERLKGMLGEGAEMCTLEVTFALSVSPAVPASVKTVADYVAWAKAHPKDANFGSAAVGATPHFVGTMLGRAGGVQLNHVPFKGGAPLVSDLLGGQVQSGVNVLPEVLPHAQSGKLRILAVSGKKRSRFLPNVPTFAESGFKDVEADEYFAVFVPSKTPPEAVAKLNAAIRAALKAKPMIDGLEKLSFDVGGESSAEFTKIVQSELVRWGPIVKASGFSSEE